MTNRRLELQTKFEELLGSKNVYFQPPESVKLQYDCIIYQQDRPYVHRADNYPYFYQDGYQITVISKDPTCDVAKRMVKEFQMCSLDRFYTADNLNHWALSLYY